MIEVAEIVIHEADEPNLLADLLDADALAGEDGAEIDLLAIEGAAAPGDRGAAFGSDQGKCGRAAVSSDRRCSPDLT